ncbi:hypothetical protein AB1Y20_003080 [Prymnesium parvum]|uniref:Phospholipid scramblase n=1 Tax=Prymnesium parvum TaxID=97485 RepID=A0AB34JD23_PRYPA
MVISPASFQQPVKMSAAPDCLDMCRIPTARPVKNWPPPKESFKTDPKYLLPIEKRRGAISKRCNYELGQSVLKSNIDFHAEVPAPADYVTEQINLVPRPVYELPEADGGGPRTPSHIPIALGIIRQGPGALCCFDDQVVYWDPEEGLAQMEITDTRFPLNLFCNGYFFQLRVKEGSKPNTARVDASSAHDFCLPCRCCPYICYRCSFDFVFLSLFYCIAYKYNNKCCCGCPGCYCPAAFIFATHTWTGTCCPCCTLCCDLKVKNPVKLNKPPV